MHACIQKGSLTIEKFGTYIVALSLGCQISFLPTMVDYELLLLSKALYYVIV